MGFAKWKEWGGGSERVTHQHRAAGRVSLGCSGLGEGNFLRLSDQQEWVDHVGRDDYAVTVDCSRKDPRCFMVGHWVSGKELGRDQREAVLGSTLILPDPDLLKGTFPPSLPGGQGKKPR